MSNPVETELFWKNRIYQTVANGKPLHQAIWFTSVEEWKKSIHHTTRVLNSHIKNGSSILDIGCGIGTLVDCLLDSRLKDFEYVGVDISPDLISLASIKYPNYEFVCSNANDLPFSDLKFDWAVCRQFKRMIDANTKSWDKIEVELRRVCKKVLLIEYDGSPTHKVL